jgi:hypothetical protein
VTDRTGARPQAVLAWCGRHERLLAVACLAPLLGLFVDLYFPMLPSVAGTLAVDYSVFVSDLLAGYYWILLNGPLSVPWFSPFECGGVPFFADPQVAYLSLAQALTLVVSPMLAVQATILVAAGAGFLGTYALARAAFRASPPAALLAATVFMFNAFFATRMLIGHMNMYAFMLLPALLLSVLPWPDDAGPRASGGVAREVLRVGCAALTLAVMILSGMLQLAVPAALSVAMVLLLAGLTVGWSWRAVARLAAAGLLGALLCAGKLAAMVSLVAQFPRDQYEPPAFHGLWNIVWLPTQMLFLGPPAALDDVIFHDPHPAGLPITLARHEFEYGITPVPALLILAALAMRLAFGRDHTQAAPRGRLLCLAGLLLLTALPAAANSNAPHWHALLKLIPVVRNSSNLMRWFAAYILPVTLAGGIALDRLAGRGRTLVAVPLAAVLVLFVLTWTARTDLTYYEDQGFGAYAFPIAPIEQAWAAAHAGAAVPPIVGISPDQAYPAAAAFTGGQSQLDCYWPLFGYGLENMPPGTMHGGEAMGEFRGRLNLRDPACDMFPADNACRPGDQFRSEDAAAARAFLSYRPYPFRRPWWIGAALCLNVASAVLLAIVLPICAWARWRARRPAAA